MTYKQANNGPLIPASEFRAWISAQSQSPYYGWRFNPDWGFSAQVQLLKPGTSQTETYDGFKTLWQDRGDSGGDFVVDPNDPNLRAYALGQLGRNDIRLYVVQQDGRLKTHRIYVFYKGYAVCAGSWQSTDSSDWVDVRGGLVFVGSVAIGGVLSAGAAAGADAAISAEASQAVSALGQQASLTGNQDLAIVAKVAKAASSSFGSTAISAADTGVSNVDDFDEFSFDPFDYSSGEAETAFSDAANVDYGFGAESPFDSASVDDMSGVTISDDAGDYSHEGNNYNATAESDVSDYGSTSQGNPGFDDSDYSHEGLNAVSVANAAAKAGSSNNSVTGSANTSGGGGTVKYGQTATSVASTIAKASSQSTGSAPALAGIGGLAQQAESALKNVFSGQLGPNKNAPTASGGNQMLIIGAALIGVALLLHFNKG